jgi:hypothetical protein
MHALRQGIASKQALRQILGKTLNYTHFQSKTAITDLPSKDPRLLQQSLRSRRQSGNRVAQLRRSGRRAEVRHFRAGFV